MIKIDKAICMDIGVYVFYVFICTYICICILQYNDRGLECKMQSNESLIRTEWICKYM